jgi:acyl dehydratase
VRVFDSIEALQGSVGQPLGSSDWVTVGAQRIARFAEATEDRQWIHIDEALARQGPFGMPIAHGFLTLSLLSHLVESAFAIGHTRMGVNYGLNRVRFPAPVPAGARLRAHFTLLDWQPVDGGAQMVIGVTVECEGVAKPVCVAEWVTRRYRETAL